MHARSTYQHVSLTHMSVASCRLLLVDAARESAEDLTQPLSVTGITLMGRVAVHSRQFWSTKCELGLTQKEGARS